MSKRYFLYDVLNDYSVAKVDGKSDFGTLAHAKTRAVKDNGGRRVLWAKKDMPGMDQSFDNWFGRNTDNELINIVSTHGLISSNPKKKKKKAPAQECEWFALCENEATTTEPHPILGPVPICKRCKDKVARLSNPRGKDSARVFHDNDKLKTVYSVEFWGDEWVIFTNTDYGSRILSRYGAGDAGRNKATKHLAQIKANKKARKKNPEIEIRELILFAENEEPLSNQFYSILKNLEKKAAKGIYDPVKAAKLWKYWIDEAVKHYNKTVLQGGYSLKQSVFTVQDRKDAAIEVERQWRDDVKRGDNPSRRKKKNNLFQIALFEKHNHVIHFYGGVSRGKLAFTQQRAKGILLATQSEAKKIAETVPEFYRKKLKFNVAVVPASMTLPTIRKKLGVPPAKTRGRNPVGPTQSEIDRAGDLFRDFTGEHPERMQNVKLPVPKTGLVIGELDGVLYTTIRDGKTEKYQHDFKKGSRPLLASSHDGKSLHVLGGEYEFTERGIEDK